jgi:predicted outer membrane protein
MKKAQLQTLTTEELHALATAFGKAFDRAYAEKDSTVGLYAQDALVVIRDILFEREIDDLNKLQGAN